MTSGLLIVALALVGADDGLLHDAEQAYREAEFDRVVQLTARLTQDYAVPLEVRREALALEASAYVVLGRQIDAERAYRLLLRLAPDYDVAADVAPKIRAVFRNVKVDEDALRARQRAQEQAERIATLGVRNDTPAASPGGTPLPLRFGVRDPRGLVMRAEVSYRRNAADPYSTLGLQRDDSGAWAGALPGEWTASEAGFTLQYVLRTFDAEGTPLLVSGADQPNTVAVSPGELEVDTPFHRSVWFWALLATAAAAAGGITAAVLLIDQPTPTDYSFRLP